MLIERLGHQIEGTQLFFLTDQGQQQPFPVMLHTMPGVPGHVSPRIPTSVRLDGASPVVPVSMAPESEPAMSRKTLEQPSTSTGRHPTLYLSFLCFSFSLSFMWSCVSKIV